MVLDLSVGDWGRANPFCSCSSPFKSKFCRLSPWACCLLSLMYKIAWYLATFGWQESICVVSFVSDSCWEVKASFDVGTPTSHLSPFWHNRSAVRRRGAKGSWTTQWLAELQSHTSWVQGPSASCSGKWPWTLCLSFLICKRGILVILGRYDKVP